MKVLQKYVFMSTTRLGCWSLADLDLVFFAFIFILKLIPQWILDKRLWMLSVYTGVGVVVSTSLLALLTQCPSLLSSHLPKLTNIHADTISFSTLLNVPVFSFLMCISFLLPLVLLRRWDLQRKQGSFCYRKYLLTSSP